MISPELARYYASPEWEKKRRECFDAWQWACAVCGQDWRGVCPLQCHHLPGAYAKLGREDIWDDLRPLCKRHHGRGRITLDGIRLARKAYQWNKRIRWFFGLLGRMAVWSVKLLWKGIRWLVRRRPTAAG